MSTQPIVGKTYTVKHQRKGTFRARVLVVGDPWIRVVILEPVTGYVDTWDTGEELEVRASLATFEEVIDEAPSAPVSDDAIPPSAWGRDHFTTLLYVETCVVDDGGKLNAARMRHSTIRGGAIGWLTGSRSPVIISDSYPTRLRDGTTVHQHDDWSCVEDMVAAGLVVWGGTGKQPILSLTSYGWLVASALRQHRAASGKHHDFVIPARHHSALDVETAHRHLSAACFVHQREVAHFLARRVPGEALEAEPTIQSIEAWIQLLAQMSGVPNPIIGRRPTGGAK